MKINEIEVDPYSELIAHLREGYSQDVYRLFRAVEGDSKSFTITSQDIYSLDEIEEFIYLLRQTKKACDFDNDKSETSRVISYLLQYFSE